MTVIGPEYYYYLQGSGFCAEDTTVKKIQSLTSKTLRCYVHGKCLFPVPDVLEQSGNFNVIFEK